MQERCNLFDAPTQKVDINHLKSHFMIGRASAGFLNLVAAVLKGITINHSISVHSVQQKDRRRRGQSQKQARRGKPNVWLSILVPIEDSSKINFGAFERFM
jgi:hypothetical protein